jgi:hypothetical protein
LRINPVFMLFPSFFFVFCYMDIPTLSVGLPKLVADYLRRPRPR